MECFPLEANLNGPGLLPPVPEKMPGRPKNNTRRKNTIEIQETKGRLALQKAEETGKLGRHGMIMTCSYCKQPGPNKAGCVKRANEVPDASKKDQAKGKQKQTAKGKGKVYNCNLLYSLCLVIV